MSLLIATPLIAALRDLAIFIPILIIVAVLSAYGIVLRGPRSSRWDDDDSI
jgi:hypothetical protein